MNFDLKPIKHKPKTRAPSKNMSCKEIAKRIIKVMEQLPNLYDETRYFYIGFDRINKNVFYMNDKDKYIDKKYFLHIKKCNNCYKVFSILNYYDLKKLVED